MLNLANVYYSASSTVDDSGHAGCMDVREQVGRNVRHLRQQAGLSQEELAFRAGVTRGYLNGIERYVRNPTIIVLYRFSEALGVTMADVVSVHVSLPEK